MRIRNGLWLGWFVLGLSVWGSAQSPAGDALLELRGLTGRPLEAACDRMAREARWKPNDVRYVGGGGIVYRQFESANEVDRLTLARLMARLGQPYHEGLPDYGTICGNGLKETNWYGMRESLRKALIQQPKLVPQLLRDPDPAVAGPAIEVAGDTNPAVRNSLLAWSNSKNPRFRMLSALHVELLSFKDQATVVDRLLHDPLLAREAIRGVGTDSATYLFSRLRTGFKRGNTERKLAILQLGVIGQDRSVSEELAIARTDPDPEVRKAAKEFGSAIHE